MADEMGRNRKPKALAELDGTFEKHPERRAGYEQEPKPAGPLGDPPRAFDAESYTGSRLLEIWNEIVSGAPPGILSSSDRLHVEMSCRAIFRIRYREPKASDFNTVREFLGKMAMNPADRPKIQVGVSETAVPAKKGDEQGKAGHFAEIAEEVRQNSRPN